MKFDFPKGEHNIKDNYRILTNLSDNTLSINFEYFFGGNVSLIFDKTDINRLEDHIKYFRKREGYLKKKEESETITKPIIEFSEDELDNMCSKHPGCINCPISGLSGSVNCLRALIKHPITVKESDLKDG